MQMTMISILTLKIGCRKLCCLSIFKSNMRYETTSKSPNSIGGSDHSLACIFHRSCFAGGFTPLRTAPAASRQFGGYHSHPVFACRSAPSDCQLRHAILFVG